MSQNKIAMAELKTLQEWMLNSLTSPMMFDPEIIGDHILPAANISAEQSLAIYQRSYILRLRKCLAEQFPATCYALREKLFDAFADAYLQDYPSQSHTLYELGNHFPIWLEVNRIDKDLPKEKKEHWIDFMVDLASYEQTLFRLFDAQGAEQETPVTYDIHDEQLRLQPIFSLQKYRYHVAEFYHEVRAANNPDLPAKAMQTLALTRVNYQTYSFPINSFQYAFLFQLQKTNSVEKTLRILAKNTKLPLETVRLSWQKDIRKLWIDAGFFVAR